MNKLKVVVTTEFVVIIILVTLLILQVFLPQPILVVSLIDQLNLQGADIGLDDNYFRITIFSDQGKKYVSENVSWNYLVSSHLVESGRVTSDSNIWYWFVNENCQWMIHRGSNSFTSFLEVYY